jgi:hypothetical protein
MANETFSAEESLQLIQSMIDRTRKSFSDRSHYFLLWGWSALVACLAQYMLKVVYHYPRHYLVWWITLICLAATLVLRQKDRRRASVRTYVNENLNNVWTGLAFTFFVLSMIFVRFGFVYCYPFFITLYGAGAFISGRILQFAPLTWGGIAGWILAIGAVWFDFDIQVLLAAAALLICFIIPGHMLRIRYNHS